MKREIRDLEEEKDLLVKKLKEADHKNDSMG